MKRITLKSFVSRATIFVAGKNFKADTLIESTPESIFIYEMDSDKLFLIHKGNLRVLNGSTIAHWEPLNYADVKEYLGFDVATPSKPAPIHIGNPGPIKAQVEVPHEKVQNPPTRRSVKLENNQS